MENKSRFGGMLDYSIGILMIAILILATFLLPNAYSTFVDNQDLNQIHIVEREDFSFGNPVELVVGEQVQQIMGVLAERSSLRRTLSLTGSEMADTQLIDSVKEALIIAAQYKLLPDLTAYELEKYIVNAEYYNLSDNTTESADAGFWKLRFSDYAAFDFCFYVDAARYIIYQAEVYSPEVTEYVIQLISDDLEVVSFLHNQFMEGCGEYFEAEGYETLTDMTCGDMVFMMGFERGEYAMYHSPAENGFLGEQGIRWGFIPMTAALESGAAAQEWNYMGVVAYYEEMFSIDLSGENPALN